MSVDRPCIPVPAAALTGADTILVDPDTGDPCVWQITSRTEFTEGDPLELRVAVEYFMPDDPEGTIGRHVFTDCRQDVIVRLPRYSATASAA